VLPWQSRSLTECSLIRKLYVDVMTTDAGLNRLGISMYWIFPFCGVKFLYSFWLISRNPWFWDFFEVVVADFCDIDGHLKTPKSIGEYGDIAIDCSALESCSSKGLPEFCF
jgi:hypothetical protein